MNKYKSAQGRLTLRPFAGRGVANGLRLSGFYSAGWYAADRPRRLGIVMGSFEHTQLVATLQYLKATENPSAAVPRDIHRSGSSGFVEIRQGLQRVGGAGAGRLFRSGSMRSAKIHSDASLLGARTGSSGHAAASASLSTNEQVHYGSAAARVDENRLLVQTYVEF